MSRTRTVRLCSSLGALVLVGALASTTALASTPEVSAQRAEDIARQQVLADAESEVLDRSRAAQQVAERSAAEDVLATRLAEQLGADQAAALEAAAAAQAALEQAAAEQAAAEQAAADAAAQAAADAAAKQAARPSPAPAAPAAPAAVPACVNDSTYTGPPFYTSPPAAEGDGSNGNIPASSMTRLSWGHDTVGTPQYLLTPAAGALDRLNAAYRATFGEDMDLDLTYRSYAEQVRIREVLGTIAATPGTSTHGTGRALDLPEWSCYGFGSARYTWLVENGPAYGWVAPSWARKNGANPEYWHFEYVG